uniref:Chromosome 1 open reading frame 210 n=1 Tax=Varanus komodoensis TaxID=61221 RepID=A0A8D2J187_VARKO
GVIGQNACIGPTTLHLSGRVAGRSWPYFAGFVLSAIGISILIVLVAKCKLLQRNHASYHHQRLNQPIDGAAGSPAEDDDGFIEDNYIEPNRDLKEEEEEVEGELEPHFRV